MNISWTPPEPRPGLAGEWDKFVGPGATAAEFWLTLGVALAAGLAVPLYAYGQDLGWTAAQHVAGTVLAMDLAGGVVANAAAPAKRWYHREGQGARQQIGFVLAHGAHLLLVTWLFHRLDWAYFAGYYAYLVGAAWAVLRVPLYLQRPAALALVTGAIFLNSYGLTAAPGLEWFIPVLFLKLLAAHLVKEAPFRPG